MRIGINTLSVTPDRGGVRTYLTNVTERLVKAGSDHDFVFFVGAGNAELWPTAPNVHTVGVPLRRDQALLRTGYEQVVLPRRIRDQEIDVLWSPNNVAILRAPCAQVLTLQGPLALRNIRDRLAPNHTGVLRRAGFDTLVPPSARRCAKVVCVSEFIEEALIKWLGPESLDTVVVPEGVDFDRFASSAEGNGPVEPPYVLFVSTLFPYKNAGHAIRAFAQTDPKLRGDHQLVVAGRDPGGISERLERLAEAEGVASDVRLLGRVPDEKMPSLYADATAFVFPSGLESFGLPPLEAMAAGTPVISSNRCSLPEVVGDAGVLVDPEDIDEFSDSLERVLGDEEFRSDLKRVGRDRAKRFTWTKTAKGVLDALEDAAREDEV